MPASIPHEIPLLLFRECPALIPRLLRDALGIAVPAFARVQVEDAEFSQIVPTEYHADLVLTLSSEGAPVMGIVVEVQRQPDARKRRSWPVYVAALHARLGCATCLVVVATTDEVARWARQPITTFQPGSAFAPIVLGLGAIPLVTSHAEASRSPELAVLSALAHGQGEHAREVAEAALGAALRLDEEWRALYVDTILNSLGGELREALEAAMDLTGYEFKSPLFKKLFAEGEARAKARGEAEGRAQGRAQGEAEGRARGEAEGRAQGEAEGRAQGEAEGRAYGEAHAILTVLSARGLAVSEEIRARVLGCRDFATLERWVARAATSASAEEAIGDS